MVTTLGKSRRRLPRGALSFASPGQVAIQLIALASALALGLVVTRAASSTFAALVAAFQQSTPTEWMNGTALVTTAWVLTFVGSSALFKWGLSRALTTVFVPLSRRRRFHSEAYFGPGLKGRSRLDS